MHHTKQLLENNHDNIPLGVLISIIHRTRIIHLNSEMKDLELTASQIPFLIQLSHKEGVTQTISQFIYTLTREQLPVL